MKLPHRESSALHEFTPWWDGERRASRSDVSLVSLSLSFYPPPCPPAVSFRATLPPPPPSPWISEFSRVLSRSFAVPSGVHRLQHDEERDFADSTVFFESRWRSGVDLSADCLRFPSVALTRVLNIRRDFKINLGNFSVIDILLLFFLRMLEIHIITLILIKVAYNMCQLGLIYFYIIIILLQIFRIRMHLIFSRLTLHFIFSNLREIDDLSQGRRASVSPPLCCVAKLVIRVALETAVKQHRGGVWNLRDEEGERGMGVC